MKAAFENTDKQTFNVYKSQNSEMWNLSRAVGQREFRARNGHVLGYAHIFEHFSFHIKKQPYNWRVDFYKDDKRVKHELVIRKKDIAWHCRQFVKEHASK